MGGQTGRISSVLEQTAWTLPLMHTHLQAAPAFDASIAEAESVRKSNRCFMFGAT